MMISGKTAEKFLKQKQNKTTQKQKTEEKAHLKGEKAICDSFIPLSQRTQNFFAFSGTSKIQGYRTQCQKYICPWSVAQQRPDK